MFSRIQNDSHPAERPRKGIRAEVLVAGLSPAPPKDSFTIDRKYSLLVSYLLESGRCFVHGGFSKGPNSEASILFSEPKTLDHYRVAFGLTLYTDMLEANAKMAMKLHMAGNSVSRFITSEQASAIRFLEAMEGVDEVSVRFRYNDITTNSVVKGAFSL